MFAVDDRTTLLTSVHLGQHVVVFVTPGAFVPRAVVDLTFADASGVRILRSAPGSADGSLEAVAIIPKKAASGPARVGADSASGDGEYDRAWLVHVTE